MSFNFIVDLICANSFKDVLAPEKVNINQPKICVINPKFSAIILGSSQTLPDVKFKDFEFIKRNTGGGAVVVKEGEFGWIDIYLPTNLIAEIDPNYLFVKVGNAFLSSLKRLNHLNLGLWQNQSIFGKVGKTLCFASRVKGEIIQDKSPFKKIVGFSQRRTREFVKIQAGYMFNFDPGLYLELYEFLNNEKELSEQVINEITLMADCLCQDPEHLAGLLVNYLPIWLGFG